MTNNMKSLCPLIFESLVVLQLSTLGDMYCKLEIIRKLLATLAHSPSPCKHPMLLGHVLPQLLLGSERSLTAVIGTLYIVRQLMMASHVCKYSSTTNALLSFQGNFSF